MGMNRTVTTWPDIQKHVGPKGLGLCRKIHNLIYCQMSSRLIIYPTTRLTNAISVIAFLHHRINFRGLVFEEFLPSLTRLSFPSLKSDLPAILTLLSIPFDACGEQEMLRCYEILLADSAFLERDKTLRLE